jgi:branched-chain amino acid transport system permease protein
VDIVQAAVEGLAYGGLYALLGLGFFLTYGVLRRIDLAYGTVIMASVYIGAMIANASGLPWSTLPPVILGVAIPVSLVVAFLAFRLIHQDARFSMAATLGIWMAIEELILQSPGRGRGQAIENPLQDSSLWLLNAQLRLDYLLLLLIALALAWLVARFLADTRAGLAIRVAAHDASTAALLGISHGRTMTVATVLAASVGSIAGWAFAVAQSGIDLHFGMWATIKGLAILVLGGTKHISFIVIAALGLGVAEHIGTEIIGTGYLDLLAYGLMFVLLAIAPTSRFIHHDEGEP